MELKPGVRLDNMSPQIGLAVQVAWWAWWDTTVEYSISVNGKCPSFVVTSINDGKHSRTSLHHVGHACDLRTKTLPTVKAKRWFAAEVRRRLGSDFDVFLEDLGKPNEHLHLQYRPKR